MLQISILRLKVARAREDMRKYILRRLLYAIPTLIGISIVIFVAMRVIPGDPIIAMLGGASGEGIKNLSEADRARIMEQLGLADPIHIQYLKWMKDVVTLELGESFFRGDSVRDTIIRRGPISAEIGIFSIILSWLIGLPVGILSALRPNSIMDAIARTFTILFLAIPGFWLAMLTVLAMVVWFNWASPLVIVQLWQDPRENLAMVAGPSVILGLGQAAYMARMSRSSILEVVGQDYVRTARAKGLVEQLILYRHTLPNALLPVITLSGLMMGFVIGGSVAIEKAFSINGLGLELVRAVELRDWVVIQNLVLFYGFIFVFVNLIVDISYGWVDPRIRYE